MALTRFQDTEQIQKDIQDLTKQLENLRIIYEQYFLGIVREEPTKLRKSVRDLIQRNHGAPIQNASLKFQLQQCVARYNTFCTYWDRVLKQMEEGTYQRDIFKANLHEKERKGKSRPGNLQKSEEQTNDIYQNLFDQYKELRKQLKHDTTALSFDSFKNQLKKKMDSSGVKDSSYSFKVVQENKEIKIKLLKKKTLQKND